MEHSRKMVLLPEDSYKNLINIQNDSFKSIQTPGDSLTRKDDEMHRVLESNLSNDEKWKKYEQLLQHYLFYKNPRKDTLLSNIESNEYEQNNITGKEYGISNSKIISSLPKTFQKIGSNLLDFIRTTRNVHEITWDDKGVVKVDNEDITDSNIIDLINDLVRNRKSFNSIGRWKFIRVLWEMGVPQAFIGNHELVNAMNKSFNKSMNGTSFDTSTKRNQSLDSFKSFADGTLVGKISTPRSTKKFTGQNQTGNSWSTLNI